MQYSSIGGDDRPYRLRMKALMKDAAISRSNGNDLQLSVLFCTKSQSVKPSPIDSQSGGTRKCFQLHFLGFGIIRAVLSFAVSSSHRQCPVGIQSLYS